MYDAVVRGFDRLSAKGKEPNFVFVGGSLFQLASLVAFINKKHEEGKEMCGVVCDWVAPPHRRQICDTHITCISQDSFIRLEAGKDFDFSLNIGANLKETFMQACCLILDKPKPIRQFTEDDPLYFFYPSAYEPNNALWNTVLRLSNHIRLIRYDEGLGTYVIPEVAKGKGTSEKQKLTIRSLCGKAYGSLMGGIDNSLCRMRRKRVQVQDCLLFEKASARCILNQKYAALYEDAFCQFAASRNLKGQDYAGAVIVLGFDFAKIGDTIPSELKMYRKIQNLLKQYGVSTLFRPHPAQSREHVARYSVLDMRVFDEADTPLESLLAASANKPVAIIGLGSTAQATANAFWGVPCISVSKLFQCELADQSHVMQALDSVFRQHEMVSELFSDYMMTPETYEELAAELDELLRKG